MTILICSTPGCEREKAREGKCLHHHIEELNEKIPKWIDIADELPPPMDSYFVINNGYRETLWFNTDKTWGSEATGWELTEPPKVTHWMLLPDLPK